MMILFNPSKSNIQSAAAWTSATHRLMCVSVVTISSEIASAVAAFVVDILCILSYGRAIFILKIVKKKPKSCYWRLVIVNLIFKHT